MPVELILLVLFTTAHLVNLIFFKLTNLSVNALLSLSASLTLHQPHTPLSATVSVDMLVPIMTFVLYVFAKERFAL